jgi:hypothetical protein
MNERPLDLDIGQESITLLINVRALALGVDGSVIAGELPANALTWRGEPVTWRGEQVTWR